MTDWAIPEKQSDGEITGLVVEKGELVVRRIGKREEREGKCLWG